MMGRPPCSRNQRTPYTLVLLGGETHRIYFVGFPQYKCTVIYRIGWRIVGTRWNIRVNPAWFDVLGQNRSSTRTNVRFSSKIISTDIQYIGQILVPVDWLICFTLVLQATLPGTWSQVTLYHLSEFRYIPQGVMSATTWRPLELSKYRMRMNSGIYLESVGKKPIRIY